MLMFIFPLLPFFRTAGPKEEPKVGKHFSATISVCLSALKGKKHEFSLFAFWVSIVLSCLSVATMITLHGSCCMGR